LTKLTTEQKQIAYKKVIPIAKSFREKHLPKNERLDTFKILEEQMGCFILKFPSKNDKLSGFHIEKSGIHCIYINSGHSLGRQYFSAWHECYHAINNQNGICLTTDSELDIEEYKADCFAGCILMPENIVKKYIEKYAINPKYLKHDDVIKMHNYFRVSYSAMVTRLIQIYPQYKSELNIRYHLGKKERADELKDKTLKANCKIDLIEPTNDVYVSDKFFENIKFSLENDRISEEKALSLLDMLEKLEDFNEI